MRALAAALLIAVLALAACGRVGPPVAPELREPQPVTSLAAVATAGGIELSWTNPGRRADQTRLLDLATARVFRVEDAGTGEPKPALRTRERIAGYTEVATIPLAAPGTATVTGNRVVFTDRQGLTLDRRYTYVVLVEDAHGRVSPPSTRLSVTYLAPPASPTALVADAGESEVTLRWQAPARLADGRPVTGDLVYEMLRRREPDGLPQTVTVEPLAATRFTDRSVENDRTYTYAVRALRRVGGSTARGEPSDRVAATPLDMTPPSPPRNLVAVIAADGVRLSWAPSPDADVAAYVVYRAPARGGFVRVGSARAPATTFTDRDVAAGTYRYVVTAEDAGSRANESGRSNEVTVGVP